METQIFKKTIPKEFIINFLEKICDNTNDYLLLNKAAFRKSEFHNLLSPFLEELKEYYHKSKQFYLTRKLSYNYFLTIIRQICKNSKIRYENKVIYTKSLYDVTYHIFID